MGAQKHFDGRKLAGKHTTVSEATNEVLKELSSLPVRINAGFIKSGVRASHRRVVVRGSGEGGSLPISVIGNGAVQEVRIFTDDPKVVIGRLKSLVGFEIVFR